MLTFASKPSVIDKGMKMPLSCCLAVFVPIAMWTSTNSSYATTQLTNVDKRTDHMNAGIDLEIERAAGLAALQRRIPAVRVDMDYILASPKYIYNRLGFLTAPDSALEMLQLKTLQSIV